MDIKDFKAGHFIQQYQYKSFSPTHLNQSWTWSEPKINTLLEDANQKLGELNAFSLYVPNVDFFISMHVAKEATTSSRIEGTKTGLDEALLTESDIIPEKRDDWREVQNYIEAMNYAIESLKSVPLSTRLLKETHKILLKNVRGRERIPGEYRTSQNWIGGATLNDAVFIPPHHQEINNLMYDLENFLHNKNIDVPHLIKVALMHYQFETIHPFLDGNGRIGRLLITLYLVSSNILQKPTLYLSDYFEKHKGLYYDNLTMVRSSSNVSQWIKYFLVAVIETAKRGISTFQSIISLRENINQKLIAFGNKSKKSFELVNRLYEKPFINAGEVASYIGVTHATAYRYIKKLENLGIIREITKGKRNRIFYFEEYYNLFK
jgi:Fic family protein